MKHYYAARHTHGKEFVYPDGWTAYVFDTLWQRDDWVSYTNNWDSRNGFNQRSQAVTRNIARKIAGSRVVEAPINGYNFGHMLESYESYFNPNYWS